MDTIPMPQERSAATNADHVALVEWVPRTTTTRCPSCSPTAEGAWVTDVEGRRYLDCLAGYSALNFGHGHPALVEAAQRPARAADADQPRVPQRPARPVLPRPAELAGMDLCCR